MTRALDTNVVARALAERDTHQHDVAIALLAQPFTISLTVMMETEWVLRSVYRWPRDRIALAFLDVIDLPHFIGPSLALDWIIAKFSAGADFADMVHIRAATGAETFATFDTAIAPHAGPDTPLPIETLA